MDTALSRPLGTPILRMGEIVSSKSQSAIVSRVSADQKPGRDTALIRKSLKGDAESYGELVGRYSARLINLAFMMVGDRHLAEDIAQEAFIRAFRSLGKFERRAKFSSWLYQIALNLCKDHLKAKSRHAKSMEREQLAALDGGTTRLGAPRQAAKMEFTGALADAINALPYLYREAFVLRHLQDLEYDEISKIAGVPADTVRVRAYRARELLRGALSPQVDTFWREKAEKEKR